ncbi:MAG TPA: STAS domain-containing protein [Burkholderiales bacterium]|nr:STAS domain-containing protein [Burkholderiales bacterium]
MNAKAVNPLFGVLQTQDDSLLDAWMKAQTGSMASRKDLIKETELREQSRKFLAALRTAAEKGGSTDINSAAWDEARDFLKSVSASRAQQGFTPTETAMFVFSLKEPVFEQLRKDVGDNAKALASELWQATTLFDRLGLYTTEAYQQSRNDVIGRQQAELLELSTPVVQLWEGILALPLVGTLDSSRTQVVMESLLQRIVDTGSEIAIIDITGVPTVDTLVAQHLMKTIAATRLMGADCIISGIRPQIAQTIVHLGVDLGEVTTKATLADALAAALKRLSKSALTPTA